MNIGLIVKMFTGSEKERGGQEKADGNGLIEKAFARLGAKAFLQYINKTYFVPVESTIPSCTG